MMLKLS